MKKVLLFAKRNFLEMLRDPILYIFCAGFPIAMTLMFQIILKYTKDPMPIFEIKSLIPGIMMFSFSLLMLMSSLLVSKDKTSAFLKRLFTSPMKAYQFILGYFIPLFIIGLVQILIGVILGYIFGGINHEAFASFPQVLLLIVSMIPLMIFNIMIGMLFGTILNDKSAPAISSIFISASGIIGGAWMPVDAMGNFEKVIGFFPFYPSSYLGRVILGATHTPLDAESALNPVLYTFDTRGGMFIGLILGYMLISITLSIFVFKKRMASDRF